MGILTLTRFFILQGLSGENQDFFGVYIYGLGHDMRTFSAAFYPCFYVRF
ncbi:hypothetical protein [Helicobacter winghamensis]|nr:hypothetical protein [Helicobacter winghamensis]